MSEGGREREREGGRERGREGGRECVCTCNSVCVSASYTEGGSVVPTATVKPQVKPQVTAAERKVIRIKKRAMGERLGPRSEVVREGEGGGGREEGSGDGSSDGGTEKIAEKITKNGVSLVEASLPVKKRRKKLARKPVQSISSVQATPTTATPTITLWDISPTVQHQEVTNDSQTEPITTKPDQTKVVASKAAAASSSDDDDDVTVNTVETETTVDQVTVAGTGVECDEMEREEKMEGGATAGQRKMSITEMKAQM